MITLFNIAIFSLLFAARGGGLPKWVYLVGSAVIIALAHQDLLIWAAYMWVVVVTGVFPTSCLLSTVNGQPPSRDDSWAFQWMQDAAKRINSYLPVSSSLREYWKRFGVIYGVVRNSAIIPVALVNPLTLLLLLQGLVYYVSARIFSSNPVRYGEYLTGAMIGACLG